MRKNTVNFLADLPTLLAILAMTGTGLILKYSLPPGSGGRGLMLWGLGRHDWGGVHFWIAVGLGVLLVVHLVLHWPWVVGTFRRLTSRTGARAGRPAAMVLNVSCVAFLLATVAAAGGFALVANSSVSTSAALARGHAREHAEVQPGSSGFGRTAGSESAAEDHDHGPLHIRGSMTLADVALESGLPVTTLLALLELPDGTSSQERLGMLCRTHGLSMSTVRSIITEHAETPSGE